MGPEDYKEKMYERLEEHHEAYDDISSAHSLRRKVTKLEQKAKHEQYMRRRYPSVNEAFKQYQMVLKLVKNHK